MRRALICAALISIASAQSSFLPIDETGYQALVRAHRGKLLLVDFWATWCEPCRAELRLLVRLEARCRAKGLVLATISADEPEKEAEAIQFLFGQKAPPPLYVKHVNNNDRFINSIDPKWSGALPALFLYDRQGRRVKSFIGQSDIPEIEAEVRKLL